MSKCAHCGKQKGDHQAKTEACPIGSRTRIGFISFSTTNFFTAKKTKKPSKDITL